MEHMGHMGVFRCPTVRLVLLSDPGPGLDGGRGVNRLRDGGLVNQFHRKGPSLQCLSCLGTPFEYKYSIHHAIIHVNVCIFYQPSYPLVN